nr:hypothetical protein [uncultured Pseudomonas sp.]
MSNGKAEYYAFKGMLTELPPERQKAIEEAAQEFKAMMAKGEDQLLAGLLVIMEMSAKS